MAVNFAERRKQAEDAGLISDGGGFYKYKNGDNRIRLMSECEPHTSTFSDGKKSFKWLCYVLDRRDGKVKAHFMPHTIYKQIEALQANPDYGFEDVPMPYDVTVNAKNAGTIDVEYTVIPARKETPLTDDEQADLLKQKSLADLKAAIDAKKKGGAPADEPPHPADDDPPF